MDPNDTPGGTDMNAFFSGPAEPANPVADGQTKTVDVSTPATPPADNLTPPPEDTTPPSGIMGELDAIKFAEPPAQPEPTPTPEPAAPASLAQPAQSKPADPLDFLKPEEKAYFNQMSAPARKWVTNLALAANKLVEERERLEGELKEATAAQWYSSPDAVKSHPEYRAFSTALGDWNDTIRPYWEDQLVALREGKPAFGIKQGTKPQEYVQGDPLPAGPRGEAFVLAQLNRGDTYATRLTDQLTQLTATFQPKAEEVQRQLQTALDSVQSNLPAEAKKDIDADVAKLFPAPFRNRTEYKLIGAARYVIGRLMADLKAANDKLNDRQHLNRVASGQGPSVVQSAQPSANGGYGYNHAEMEEYIHGTSGRL